MRPIMYTHTHPLDYYEKNHSYMGDYEYMTDKEEKRIVNEKKAALQILLLIIKGALSGILTSIILMSL